MYQHFNVEFSVMTPVHIGCGEEYYPTDYAILNNKLNIIDQSQFLEKVIKEGKYEQFLRLTKTNTQTNMALMEFLRNNSEGCYNYSSDMGSAALKYIKKEGAFRAPISKFIRNPLDDRVYIPGSTVKGAVRSVIIEFFMREIEKRFEDKIDKEEVDRKTLLDRLRKKCRELEDFLIMDGYGNRAQNDIMKFVKVSDFSPISEIHQKIYKTFAIGKPKDGAREIKNIPDILECVDKQSEFKGEITIHSQFIDNLNKILRSLKLKEINQITENLIAYWMRFYYVNKVYLWEDEYFKFNDESIKTVGGDSSYQKYMDILKTFKLIGVEKNEFYIKTGKHGGAVSKTIEGCRQITIKVGRDKKISNHQSTLWLAGGYPMGWMKGKIEAIN